MKDEHKTKDRLINELVEVRQRITELEASEAQRKQVEKALRSLAKATVGVTGQECFDRIVSELCKYFAANCGIVGQIIDKETVRTLSMELDGEKVRDYEYWLQGTPCENVSEKGPCLFPQGVCDLFPDDKDLVDMKAKGYVGTPIRDRSGNVLGILCAISRRNIEEKREWRDVIDIMAARAAAEIERKRAEEALRESEERYRTFVRNFQGIAYQGDMNFTPIFLHGAVEEITGYTEDEFTAGKPRWDQVIHPDDLPKVYEDAEKIRSIPGYSTEREYRILRKDGQVRWIYEIIQNICDNSGKPILVQGALYDITERKRAEEALEALARGTASKTEEAFFPALVENLARALEARWALVGQLRGGERETVETLALWDGDHLADNITYDLAGAPCQDMARKGFVIHTDGVQAKFPQDALLRQMGAQCYAGAPLRTADGSVVGILAVLDDHPYRLPPRLEGIFRVFAARAAAELERMQKSVALEQAAEEWRRTFDTMSDMVTIQDNDFRIVRANRAAARAFGYEPEDLVGKKCYRVFHHLDCPVENCPLRRSLQSGEMESFEIWEPTIDKALAIITNPIRDAEGRMIGAVHVVRDITERKRTEATWRALNAAAAALQRAGLTEAEVYQAATEQLVALGLRGAITLLDEATDSFIFERFFLPAGLLTAVERLTGFKGAGFRFPRAHVPAYAQVVESGQAVYVADRFAQIVAKLLPESVSRLAGRLAEMVGRASAILAPLRVEDRVAGVLHVGSEWLTEADVPAITAFADQLSAALENARLYGEARRRAERLAVVNRVARTASATLHLDDLMETVYQEVAPLFQADAFFVALYDRKANELDYRLQVDEGIREPRERRPLGTGLTALVVSEKKPILIRDFEKEKDHLPEVRLWGTMKAPPSWLGVPMQIGEQVIGVISVQAYRPHTYGEEEQLLLSTIADQVAIAIENARLFEETCQRALQLQTIEEVGRRVASILDLDELLPYVVKAIQQNFGYYHVDIFLVEPATGYAVFKASSSPKDAKWKERDLRFKVGEEGMVGWVAQTGEPLLANDVSQEPRYLPDELLPETKSELVVPLEVEGRVVGVLDVNSDKLNAFEENDIFILQTLASQITIAIENARLYEVAQWELAERKRAEEEIKRHNEELASLNRVSQAITSSLDIRKVLDRIVDLAGSVVDAAYTSVVLIEEDGSLGTSAENFREGPPIEARARPQGITRQIIVSGQPVVFDEVSDDGTHNPTLVAAGVRSYAGLPLTVKEKVLGVLFVHSHAPGAFRDRLPLLTTFANQAAIAIENARLFEEARELAEHLALELEERQRMQAQLIESGKLAAIGQLVAGVAHELNNPLTSVVGYSQLLLGAECGEKIERDLERINRQAMRAARIVENLLTFARKREPRKESININDVIEKGLELQAHQLKLDRIAIVKELDEALPMTMADPFQMQQVFMNIISNAHQAMRNWEGERRLRVRSELAGDMIRLEFADTGPGIPPEIMERLFEPFFTTREVGEGTGLGLSIAYGIVKGHGGRIWAESPSTLRQSSGQASLGTGEVGKGATFIVEIPVVSFHRRER